MLGFMTLGILLFASFGSSAYSAHASRHDTGAGRGGIIPGQYIVVLNDDASAEDVARAHGVTPSHVFKSAINGFAGAIGPEKLDAIKHDPRARNVENDQWVSAFAQLTPNGVKRAGVEANITAKIDGVNDSMNVDIAVIDTGVDAAHPDLNVFKSVDCTSNSTTNCVSGGEDRNGHGTHVAGTAAAIDNGQGVVGVSPGARIWSVKVLGDSGSGSLSWVIAGVNYVTANAGEIEVVNMSLGCECSSSALDTAISNSVAAGVTYVVAAGNNSKDAATFSPANHPSVIAVSAFVDTDGKCGGLGPTTGYGADDRFASFSNFGSVVDMAAPGVSIYSTYKGGGYATMSGTSMAAPHVAGAAALHKVANPSATPAQVKDALQTSGTAQNLTCDTSITNNARGGLLGGDPDNTKESLLYVGGGQSQNQEPSQPPSNPPDPTQLSVSVEPLSSEKKGKSGSAKLFVPVKVAGTGGASTTVSVKIYQVGITGPVAQGSSTLSGDGTVTFEYSRATCGYTYYVEGTAAQSGTNVSATGSTYKITCN